MKYTPKVAEDSENTDLSGKLVHTGEEHSFDPTEKTALTIGGECPHCGESAHAPRNTIALTGVFALYTIGIVLVLSGFSTIGMLTVIGGIVWLVALGTHPEPMHRVLSQVGL